MIFFPFCWKGTFCYLSVLFKKQTHCATLTWYILELLITERKKIAMLLLIGSLGSLDQETEFWISTRPPTIVTIMPISHRCLTHRLCIKMGNLTSSKENFWTQHNVSFTILIKMSNSSGVQWYNVVAQHFYPELLSDSCCVCMCVWFFFFGFFLLLYSLSLSNGFTFLVLLFVLWGQCYKHEVDWENEVKNNELHLSWIMNHEVFYPVP